MEPNPLAERMIAELRTLLADMEAGNRPTNAALYKAARTAVEQTIEIEARIKRMRPAGEVRWEYRPA